jgi:hypothetical protein
MLIKYSRPLLMCLLVALTVTPTTLAQKQDSAAYAKCKSACRETAKKAKRNCQSKAGAERTKCQSAAREAGRKCKHGCSK